MASISFIGLGGMARAIATRAVAGGNAVELIGRDRAQAENVAASLGEGVSVGVFGAVPAGEIIVLAVPYTSAVEVVTRYGDRLSGKIIIDISNTFNADASGVLTPEGVSGAEQIAAALPRSARVVKAFNTVFGHVLAGERSLDVLFAGDDAQAKTAVSAFIESLGLRPFDVGDLAAARWLEAVGPLLMGLAAHGAGFNIALDIDVFSS